MQTAFCTTSKDIATISKVSSLPDPLTMGGGDYGGLAQTRAHQGDPHHGWITADPMHIALQPPTGEMQLCLALMRRALAMLL
jgi:hypothetical protein